MTRLILATIAACSLPAQAVIVAGAHGGGNTANNTTAASLDAAIGGSFGIYDNVVNYSNASGIYLGYNAGSHDLWVITAQHVNDNNSDLTIDGLAYQHQSRHLLTSDIELNRYSRGDSQVPSLPSVPLAATTPSLTTPLVMIGFGQNRTENATINPGVPDSTSVGSGGETGYHWSGTTIERWGTNNVSGSPTIGSLGWTGGNLTEVYPGVGTLFFTDFDQPADGQWTNSNEAQPSLGDSGGGVFYQDDGTWTLAGLHSRVFGTATQAANTAAFGNFAGHIDTATYRADILLITGTLVPEPAALASLLLALPLLAGRRRPR